MSQSHTDSVTGRALTLYLADGKMTSVVIAKLDNWSGRALVAPYTAFQSLKQRDESKKSGVYFLMGDDNDGSFVYVGESGDIGTRIEQHNKRGEIDFARICFFVSMDETLTQGQTCYLEDRLIKMIQRAGKVRLKNAQSGSSRADTLPESEKAGMDRFLNKMKIILPILGFDVLNTATPDIGEPSSTPPASNTSGTAPPSLEGTGATFKFEMGGTTARAKLEENEFVVLAGSLARKATGGQGVRESIVDDRNLLIESGVLEATDDPTVYRFTQNRVFPSPSRALNLIYGNYISGPQNWKEERTGKTLRDFLNQSGEDGDSE